MGRVLLGIGGGLAGGYGVLLLLTTVPPVSLLRVAVWLAAAVIIHDALWSPTLLGLGSLLRRVPARARRYLQGGLVVAGCLTVVALPMIISPADPPASTTILVRDLTLNLILLLGLVAGLTVALWALRVLRDRRAGRPADPDPAG